MRAPEQIPPRALLRALIDLATPLPISSAVPALCGVRYAPRGGSVPLVADCYVPRSEARATVFVFHGGAFAIGSRRMKATRYLASRLVRAGYAVIAFDYPLIFRGGDAERMIASSDRVVRWWREQAPGLGVTSQETYAAGLSAGASLMLMLAARRPDFFSRLAAFFGVYDFERLSGSAPRLMCRHLFGTPDPEGWRPYSPIHCEVPGELMLLHGTADQLVSVEQARALAAARRTRGLPTDLVIYRGAPHGFLNNPRPGVAEASIESVLEHFSTERDAGRTGSAAGTRADPTPGRLRGDIAHGF